MKKSILKNVIALTFALGALVFVAGNVFGGHVVVVVDDIAYQEEGGGSGTTVICYYQSFHRVSDSTRLCSNCRIAYNVSPNYNTKDFCTRK